MKNIKSIMVAILAFFTLSAIAANCYINEVKVCPDYSYEYLDDYDEPVYVFCSRDMLGLYSKIVYTEAKRDMESGRFCSVKSSQQRCDYKCTAFFSDGSSNSFYTYKIRTNLVAYNECSNCAD